MIPSIHVDVTLTVSASNLQTDKLFDNQHLVLEVVVEAT
jgi:hypothetical protein